MRHAPHYYQQLARNAESMARFRRIKDHCIDWFLAGVIVFCLLAIMGAL